MCGKKRAWEYEDVRERMEEREKMRVRMSLPCTFTNCGYYE